MSSREIRVTRKSDLGLDADNLETARRLNIFYRRISQAKTLSEAVREVSLLLENPFAVIDETMRLLASYPQEKMGDSDWDFLLSEGYVQHDIAKESLAAYELHRHDDDVELYHYGAVEGEYAKLKSFIAMRDGIVGGCMLLEKDRPFSEQDEALLYLAVESLSSIFYKDVRFVRGNSSALSRLALSVIDAGESSPQGFAESFERIGVSPTGRFVVACIPLKSEHGVQLSYLSLSLQAVFPKSFLVKDGLLVYLVIAIGPMRYEEAVSRLVTFAERQDVALGVSGVFPSLLELGVHACHARCVAGLETAAGEGGRVREYRSFSAEVLLEQVGAVGARGRFRNPDVALLDQLGGRRLERHEVLRAYLESGCNVTEAAKRTFMHRNTFAYRMAQIRDAIGYDFDDPRRNFGMLLDLKLGEMEEAARSRSSNRV